MTINTSRVAKPEPLSDADLAIFANLQVLVCEDDHVSLLVIKHMLSSVGAHCTEAVNGEDAVRQFAYTEFDLIVMDAMMPKMDGSRAIAVLRDIEQREGRKRVPLLMLTADSVGVARGRYDGDGVDAFMTKPFTRHDLLSTLIHLLAGHQSSK
jgi:CheY-like chemotaxis protein